MTNGLLVWKTMSKSSPLKNDVLLVFHDNYSGPFIQDAIESRIRKDIIAVTSDEATEFLKTRPQQLTGTVYILDIRPNAPSVLRNYDTGEYIEGPWLDLLDVRELSKNGHSSLMESASRDTPALEDFITITEDGIVINGNLNVTGYIEGKICYSNIE